MNRSKKVIFALTGSLLFISPLTVNASALNKSLDDFSNIISEEIEEISKLDRSPKILVAANKKIKKRLEELELKNEDLENMLNELALKNEDLENQILGAIDFQIEPIMRELQELRDELRDELNYILERHESLMH